jgi:acetyltransferase-like isoleucine patch superfamily enzyme
MVVEDFPMIHNAVDASDSELPPDLRRLLAEIKRLYTELDVRMRERWKRSLPIDELLSDRWERARALGFAAGSSVYHNSYVYGDVQVGEGTWIGPFTLLDGSGGLTIGSHCSISAGVHIYTHDTFEWALSGGNAPASRAAVRIGDSTYIGSQTVVTKSVTVGDHCVIGACSLVNRDLPPFTVAFGVPCRATGRVVVDDEGRPHVDMAR